MRPAWSTLALFRKPITTIMFLVKATGVIDGICAADKSERGFIVVTASGNLAVLSPPTFLAEPTIVAFEHSASWVRAYKSFVLAIGEDQHDVILLKIFRIEALGQSAVQSVALQSRANRSFPVTCIALDATDESCIMYIGLENGTLLSVKFDPAKSKLSKPRQLHEFNAPISYLGFIKGENRLFVTTLSQVVCFNIEPQKILVGFPLILDLTRPGTR